MIYILCCIITDFEFVRLIVREFLLYLIGFRTADAMRNNIQWLCEGGGEFEYVIERNKDISCNVAIKYLNHLYETIY